MNIYTKTGDGGETSLYGGARVGKDDRRVWCYGTVDEANSLLGVIYAALASADLKEAVRLIQKKMFVIGAQLASDERGREKLGEAVSERDVSYLENLIDRYAADSEKSKGFVIPGETKTSALFHVARTVVRRAERHLVELGRHETVPPQILKYLNRLSDALFVMAKAEVTDSFVKEVARRIYSIAEKGEISMSGKICEKLCEAAFAEGKKIGVPVCFAVADAHGTLLYFNREKGALMVSVGIAQKKAYTSAVMKKATGELAAQSLPGGPIYGINIADPNLVIFGGGFPLYEKGEIVGAIGVSGGTVEEDVVIGEAVLAVFEKCAAEGGGSIA